MPPRSSGGNALGRQSALTASVCCCLGLAWNHEQSSFGRGPCDRRYLGRCRTKYRYVTQDGEGVYGFGNFPGAYAYMRERNAAIAHDEDPYGTGRNWQYFGPSGMHEGSRR